MNPISIKVAELKPALTGLGKIVNRRQTLPVLGCLRIERTKTGRIELTATDLDTSVVVQCETPAQGEPTSFLVPFEDLNNVVKSCGREDQIIVTPIETNRIGIRFPVGSQIVEHRCDTLALDEFPKIDECQGEPIRLDEALRQSIHEAFQCASSDPARYVLNGACLDVSKPQAHYVVATDGRHLFTSNSFTLPLTESLIIPCHRFLGWREFNEDGHWTLRTAKPDGDKPQTFELASRRWRLIGVRSKAGIRNGAAWCRAQVRRRPRW